MVQQALITPEWRCAKGIELRLSSRLFGRSAGQYASLNLGLHVDDVPETVQQNRARSLESFRRNLCGWIRFMATMWSR